STRRPLGELGRGGGRQLDAPRSGAVTNGSGGRPRGRCSDRRRRWCGVGYVVRVGGPAGRHGVPLSSYGPLRPPAQLSLLSCPGLRLWRPVSTVVGRCGPLGADGRRRAPAPTGTWYFMGPADEGDIFPGDTGFAGSLGNQRPAWPIVSARPSTPVGGRVGRKRAASRSRRTSVPELCGDSAGVPSPPQRRRRGRPTVEGRRTSGYPTDRRYIPNANGTTDRLWR
ncbi:MAG: hypothetical protein QOD57_2773, partial [Actinomycetota bacterium]|nr:hypothetical protein [Actinomycetota bacterium]